MSHHLSFTRTALASLLAATLSAGLIGCGSDSSTASTTIDGSVFASAVVGADCAIYSGPDNMIGSSFTTDENGEFSVNIGSSHLANDLALVCGDGTYIDEADGSTQTAGTLAAYVAGGTLDAETSLNATPGSTIMFQLITDYGMDPTAAQIAFQSAFGYTPDITVTPTDATNPVSGSSLAALEAGLRAAAFSQLTLELGLGQGQQFALLDALAADLSDDELNGLNGVSPVTVVGGGDLPILIKGDFDTASNNFRTRTALSTNYKFTYTSQMMMGMDKEGKNQFMIHVSDHNDTAQTGLTVSVVPMMYMASKTHSAPVDGGCEPAQPGDYLCTVYYGMGSKMMNGSSMGEWDLKVMADGEAVHFYPEVMMAMVNAELGVGADNPHIKLKNSGDTITNMDDVESARTLLLFKSSLIGTTDNHSLQLYIATMESMKSFPAVYPGVALNASTMNQLNIDTMTVDVSTDPAFTTPISLSGSSNDGYWTSAAIQGLTNTVQTRLYVRMNINGLTYNNNPAGLLVDSEGISTGANEYATFSITPTAPMP